MSEIDPTGRGAHDMGAKLDAGKVLPWLCIAGFSRALAAAQGGPAGTSADGETQP